MSILFSRFRFLLMVCCVALLAACAKDLPTFVPPAQRPAAPVDQPWPASHLLALAYHDVEDADPDQAFLGVRTDRLVEQLEWLHQNGYEAVSVDQILAASRGGKPLPPKAVLLSFDDGYSSFYNRVLPILKAFNWPAVWAPVGVWVSTPLDKKVDFGGKEVDRDRFATWDQVRKLSRSPLVEIGSHTYGQHEGILANPQGNYEPAEVTRRYDPKTHTYESDAAYQARIRNDARRITEKLREVTGKAPRVWVWPYGAASGTSLQIVGEQGYKMALTLDDGLGAVDNLMSTPRMLISNSPGQREFAQQVLGVEAKPTVRVAHVDLDYVYDSDPRQMELNIGELVQRIADMKISTVFLQAFADPQGDGLVKSVYFPNHWLPVRADLFNRVAWQLMSRADVKVYAWMPVLAFDLDPSIARVTRWDPDHPDAAPEVDPDQYKRLSPFDPRARKAIIGLYEDLARSAPFDGILYHDDAVLGDFEDAGPDALAAYRAAGLPGSIKALRADPATMHRWTRFKSRYLIDFINTITRHVRAIRGPQIKTARNIFANPILHPESEAWFAQNLDDFLANYDWTVPMVMPLMEKIPPRQADAWIDRIVAAVAERPGGLDRTIFELQSRDWSKPGEPAVDSAVLAGWMRRLQRDGARSFGYYPDDFIRNQPRLEVIRPAISNAWYPYK